MTYEIYFCWCSFWVALICISSIQYWLGHFLTYSGLVPQTPNRIWRRPLPSKISMRLKWPLVESRGWLKGYKASKQKVQVMFFFSEMIRVPQWVGIRPFIIAVELLPSVQSIPYKKHWRIRMIVLITFSRNHFVKTVWSMRRLDRFAKGYVWTCSYALGV